MADTPTNSGLPPRPPHQGSQEYEDRHFHDDEGYATDASVQSSTDPPTTPRPNPKSKTPRRLPPRPRRFED